MKHYDSEDDVSESEDEDPFESDPDSDHDYFSAKKKKKTEPIDHLDHESYSWYLMNYTISKLVLHNLQTFLPDVGFELTGTVRAFYQINKIGYVNCTTRNYCSVAFP